MAPGPPALGTANANYDADPATPRHRHSSSRDEGDYQDARGALAPPSRLGKDARSMSNASIFGPRTASLANSVAPGSFSTNLRSTTPRTATRPDFNVIASPSTNEPRADGVSTERRQAEFVDQINKETKIKIGSENLLEALQVKSSKQTKEQRLRVESELTSSNRKIAELKTRLKEEVERANRAATPIQRRLSTLFQGPQQRSTSRLSHSTNGSQVQEEEEEAEEEESPTFVLAELLQALEVAGMQGSYYVAGSNELVDLLKRHPTLKYDLAWSIFGIRVQTMLLSENREVRAAGYRVTRHAIGDRKSLQTIRALQTDSMVVISLSKDLSSTIEREQALKLVRAFLDVNDGFLEVSNAVVRAVVALAEEHGDTLRHTAQLTLAEILIKDPALVIRAGGVPALSDALRDGHYLASDSLMSALLHLMDSPKFRKLLPSSLGIEGPFASLTDPLIHVTDERLRANVRSVMAILNSWSGLYALSCSGFAGISSLLLSLSHPDLTIRNVIFDFLFDILRIKTPSWTSPFLAGRRLTTYARVASARISVVEDQSKAEAEDDLDRASLVDHYTTLVLLILVRCGLIETLSTARDASDDLATNRKAILLLSEVLKLSESTLPRQLNAKLQMIPAKAVFSDDEFSGKTCDISVDLAYELDSINRTLQRTSRSLKSATDISRSLKTRGSSFSGPNEAVKDRASPDMDDVQFKSLLIETRVVSSPNYQKWKWELINDVIEGPLQNPRRVEEMMKGTKFLKRLIGFYRPFKYRFSDARNTKPNQRYVRIGCALVKGLLKTAEGTQYLMDNKILRQLAECLAQLDRLSGITSSSPLFSRDRISDTLSGGYFNLLGALGSEPPGLVLISRWRMINMFYHMIDIPDREDIVQLLLGSLDYTIDSHLRVLLGKALTASPKQIRIFATKLLRKYATSSEIPAGGTESRTSAAYWAIRLLVTQLYDPEIEVSEVAVQILHEACNRKKYLEYVVKCRPALDHLGEIGAPLLLRFLSTSIGYEYLHGLDYIIQEMDDWFLGRNEKYVTMVEASLFKAFSQDFERPKSSMDDPMEDQQAGIAPPHFYRELSRTKEGCRLLQESGHFEEFVATIKGSWDEDSDQEVIFKVKGCLWAVGNVGSMDLGAPFLERSDVIGAIIDIAEQSAVVSLKGTAFFVLGLISRSLHGMELLAERGWDAAMNEFGQSIGYILPPSLERLFPPSEKATQARPPPAISSEEMPAPLDKDDAIESRLYKAIAESGNPIFSRRAQNDMQNVKYYRPDLFSSTQVFRRVMYMLECHTVRLPIRQKLFKLFDEDLIRKAVIEEASDDEEMESQPTTAKPTIFSP